MTFLLTCSHDVLFLISWIVYSAFVFTRAENIYLFALWVCFRLPFCTFSWMQTFYLSFLLSNLLHSLSNAPQSWVEFIWNMALSRSSWPQWLSSCSFLCSKMLSLFPATQPTCTEVYLFDRALWLSQVWVLGFAGHFLAFSMAFSTLWLAFCVFETCLEFGTVFSWLCHLLCESSVLSITLVCWISEWRAAVLWCSVPWNMQFSCDFSIQSPDLLAFPQYTVIFNNILMTVKIRTGICFLFLLGVVCGYW